MSNTEQNTGTRTPGQNDPQKQGQNSGSGQQNQGNRDGSGQQNQGSREGSGQQTGGSGKNADMSRKDGSKP